MDVLRLVVTKGYSWGVVLHVHVVVMAGLQVLGLQGVGDCACDQGGQGGGGVISLLGRRPFCDAFFQQALVFMGEYLDGSLRGLSRGSEMVGVWDGEFVRTRDQTGTWWNWALGVRCVQQD